MRVGWFSRTEVEDGERWSGIAGILEEGRATVVDRRAHGRRWENAMAHDPSLAKVVDRGRGRSWGGQLVCYGLGRSSRKAASAQSLWRPCSRVVQRSQGRAAAGGNGAPGQRDPAAREGARPRVGSRLVGCGSSPGSGVGGATPRTGGGQRPEQVEGARRSVLSWCLGHNSGGSR